jgi:hypothetical protein
MIETYYLEVSASTGVNAFCNPQQGRTPVIGGTAVKDSSTRTRPVCIGSVVKLRIYDAGRETYT